MSSPSRLATALRHQARGVYCFEAAAELLITHRSWLQRTDFTAHFVHVRKGLVDGRAMALIDWQRRSPPCAQNNCPAPEVNTESCGPPRAWPTEPPSTCRTCSPGWTTPTSTWSRRRPCTLADADHRHTGDEPSVIFEVQRMPCSDTVAVLVTVRSSDHRNASDNASAVAVTGPCPARCQPSFQRASGVCPVSECTWW